MNIKIQLLTISIISVWAGLFLSCAKENASTDCVEGTNPNIWHKCLNQTLDKKGSILVDLNDDNKADFYISVDKEVYNSVTLSNFAYLSYKEPINQSPALYNFDYYVERVKTVIDTSYRPVKVSENFTVDSSIYNWLLRLTTNVPNLVLYSYTDLTSMGSSFTNKDGLIDIGDYYIAFRYYDLVTEHKGWKNGWIKLNATKERLILKEIAYHKTPETKIKVGEK